MKRIISLIAAITLCVSLFSSLAFASEFVPSIGDKDHPEIVIGNGDTVGHIIDDDDRIISDVKEGCLVITPVSEAETSTEIPRDAKETLLDVYEQLSNGDMELPYDSSIDPDDMVIRDLFDLSFLCEEHPKLMEKGGILRLTFDLGVAAGELVVAMVYVDGEWINVELINNGDGTVTCFFTQICPVVFAVKQTETPPQTGDYSGSNLILWTIVMVASAVAFVVCVVIYRKKFARHD